MKKVFVPAVIVFVSLCLSRVGQYLASFISTRLE